MAKHSVSEAARLFGVDRGQIYRAMREGRISYERKDGGGRLLDTAELQRVFTTNMSQTVAEEQRDSPPAQPVDSGSTALIEALRQQIATAEADKADLRARLDRAEQRLAAADQERMVLVQLVDRRPWWRQWFQR